MSRVKKSDFLISANASTGNTPSSSTSSYPNSYNGGFRTGSSSDGGFRTGNLGGFNTGGRTSGDGGFRTGR